MIGHIMVATDGSSLCELALDQAGELANCLGARLTVLHVVPDVDVPLGAAEGYAFSYFSEQDRMKAEGRQVLQRALQRPGYERAEGVLRMGAGRGIADVIVQEAEDQQVDLIVMSTHCRKGLQRLLNGSVAEKVLHHARQPVLFTHESSPSTRRRQVNRSVLDEPRRPRP